MILAEIETVINSRPISRVCDNVDWIREMPVETIEETAKSFEWILRYSKEEINRSLYYVANFLLVDHTMRKLNLILYMPIYSMY